jgi:hypothetical protein
MPRYVDGQNPGTAAETIGCESCWTKETHAPMSRAAAESLAAISRQPIEGVKAIPVAPDGAFRLKRRTVTVSVEEDGDLDLLEVARQALPGSVVVGVDLLDDRQRTKVDRRRAKKRTITWTLRNGTGGTVGRSHRTPTDACRAAEKLVKDGKEEVVHVHGTADGEGMPSYATYCRVQTARRVKLRITTEETLRKDPAPIGWLFFP